MSRRRILVPRAGALLYAYNQRIIKIPSRNASCIFCGNFVEIQSQIRVKLSKTKNGEYILVRPGKHCIAPDKSSKSHNRNHPDHC